VGQETDPLTLEQALEAQPERHDFYQTLRRFECRHADRPRWGRSLRPMEEPLRFGQDPDLAFPPAPIASYEPAGRRARARLAIRVFGLLGPNGPLPLHLTEYTRDRLRHASDPTLMRFLEMLSHRFVALFYRAWAQSQPVVQADRPDDDAFRTYLGALAGIAPQALRDRDAVPDRAKLAVAAWLGRSPKSAEGLTALLHGYFRVPVRIIEYVSHWLELAPRDRTTLGGANAVLGREAVLGARVPDRQGKFRLVIGPLDYATYQAFLPGGRLLLPLRDWIRNYIGFELAWDLRLILKADQVPAVALGGAGRLGLTSWLGLRPRAVPATDLILDAEAAVARSEGMA
jgi:type VI secretion system protein ImpH